VHSVPALSVPDPHRLPPLEALDQFESVELFLERAEALEPSFRLTEDNGVAIPRLCHALEGLPLALEFACARLRMLSPEQILSASPTNVRCLSTQGATRSGSR
jgi:non-specific serine/threonine protein kinase